MRTGISDAVGWPSGHPIAKSVPVPGASDSLYHFTGNRIDAATDLYFYTGQWYDPVIGRFIQPDTIVPEPANPQALNRYCYVLNSPLKLGREVGVRHQIGGFPRARE